jgi:hypothetical protein
MLFFKSTCAFVLVSGLFLASLPRVLCAGQETIDNLDSRIIYSGDGPWVQNGTCRGCPLAPELGKASGGSWEISRSWVGGSPPTASLQFTGSGVSVRCIIPSPEIRDGWGVTHDPHFFIDGEEKNAINPPPSFAGNFQYGFTVFSVNSLESGKTHELRIVNGKGTAEAVFWLDDIVVVMDDVHSNNSPPSVPDEPKPRTPSLPESSSMTSSSQKPSNYHTSRSADSTSLISISQSQSTSDDLSSPNTMQESSTITGSIDPASPTIDSTSSTINPTLLSSPSTTPTASDAPLGVHSPNLIGLIVGLIVGILALLLGILILLNRTRRKIGSQVAPWWKRLHLFNGWNTTGRADNLGTTEQDTTTTPSPLTISAPLYVTGSGQPLLGVDTASSVSSDTSGAYLPRYSESSQDELVSRGRAL